MKPARQIVKPTTRRSVGLIHASWFASDGIPHESELEAAFVRHALLCTAVMHIDAQPFRIDWVDRSVEQRSYVPDYLVTLRDRTRIVVEVKPTKFVDEDRDKFDSAAALLAKKRIGFVVITEKHVPESLQCAGRLLLRSGRGELPKERIASAVARAREGGTTGLSWSEALASGISEQDWHYLLARGLLLADTGVKLTLSSRLFQPAA
jgi:hypothetical protein